MENPPVPNRLDDRLRQVGKYATVVGLLAIAPIVVYLGVVSILLQENPAALHRLLGRSDPTVYSHPLFVGMVMLLLVSLVASTVLRLRLDLAHAGAWVSHMGIVVLAVGALWYSARGLRGDCYTMLMQDGDHPNAAPVWSPIRYFYLENSFAMHAEFGRQLAPSYARLGDLAAATDPAKPSAAQELSAAVPSPYDDVQIRVTRYLPQAVLTYHWSDDSPAAVPAARLKLSMGGRWHDVMLCPRYSEQQSFDLPGLLLIYHPDTDAEDLAKLQAMAPPELDGKTTLAILVSGSVRPQLHLVKPDGSRRTVPVELGKAIELPLATRSVQVKVDKFLQHASRSLQSQPLTEEGKPYAVPAAQVEVTAGGKTQTTYVPFATYPDFGRWQHVSLPGGRTVALCFSRVPMPLPATVRVREAQYETYSGSVMPKDYRCAVTVQGADFQRDDSISLNQPLRVGQYQLSQSAWRPDAQHVEQIVLGVASRPGVPLVYVGFVMICLGFPWAFYVKPMLLRRRKAATGPAVPPALPPAAQMSPPQPSPGQVPPVPVPPSSGATAKLGGAPPAAAGDSHVPKAILLLMILLAGLAVPSVAGAGEVFDDKAQQFLRQVDGDKLRALPVQTSGRMTILDTVAREQLSQALRRETVGGLSPSVAYMELYFRTGAYLDKPLLEVKEAPLRAALAKGMAEPMRSDFLRSRRLPMATLLDDDGRQLLRSQGRATDADFARCEKIPSLAATLSHLSEKPELRVSADRLAGRYYALLSPEQPRLAPLEDGRWAAPHQAARSPLSGFNGASMPSSHARARQLHRAAIAGLQSHWRQRNAASVNDTLATIATRLDSPQARQELGCPSVARAGAELLYNRTYKATIVWIGFAAALMVLIVASVAPRRPLVWTGVGLFAVSGVALLAAFIVRWALSGRPWYLPPIMNQFESVTGSVLLACAIGAVLYLWTRDRMLLLAASFYATVAMLASFFLPEQMDASISVMPGILNSPVMAIHVALIIIGHALAGMTLPISVAYLVAYLARRKDDQASCGPDLCDASRTSATASVDRCNLIVAQLACWTIILGTITGSYWADFAWGRWWGWDAKEVWALITALVFMALLHVRFLVPARRRGLYTALLCVFGAMAMLFNWIGVNYLLRGLHSYA